MRDPFSGIRLKRRRAWDQIKELEGEILAYLATEPYQPSVNFDVPTRILTATVRIEKTPNPMWGVFVGEIIHNLRSGLDHLVWELAIRSRGSTPSLPSKLQFPVFETEPGFESRGVPVQLKKIDRAYIDMIKAEQPFATGENTDSPLWHLTELSNADKHRTLHITGALLQEWQMTFQAAETMTKTDIEIMKDGPIQQNAVLYRGHFTGTLGWPFASKDVTGRLVTNVAFDRATPAVGGWLVLGTLENIANRTDKILRRFGADVFRIEL